MTTGSNAPNASAPTLSEVFHTHLAPELRAAHDRRADLEDTLARLATLARETWPEVRVSDCDLVACLAARLSECASGGATLESLHVSELYLICGFQQGDVHAARALDQFYMRTVAARLARRSATVEMIEDITQTLYQRLLPGTANDPRRAGYSGRGDLLGWLYVAAIREARNVWSRDGKLTMMEDARLADLSASGESHDVTYMKRKYRAEFKAAFHEALASLSARERNLLRYNLLEGLNIERLGETYGVHRATVARWIARTREKLLYRTREIIVRSASGEGAELENLIPLIQSHFDVSIRRLLDRTGHEAKEE